MLNYAIENSLNIINASTLRNTELIMKNIRETILPAGFSIKAYIMAVSPEESYFSTMVRFIEQQNDSDCLTRFTDKKFHDEAFIGLNNTIIQFENNNIPITICKRASKKDQPAIIVFPRENMENETLHSVIDMCRKESYNRIQYIKKNIKDRVNDKSDFAKLNYEQLIELMKLEDEREL